MGDNGRSSRSQSNTVNQETDDGENTESPTASPHSPAAASATATEAANPHYCIRDSKHEHSNTGDMIRCCLCYQWCHEDCVNFDPKYDTAAWWLCRNCRRSSKRIAVLEQNVLTLSNTVQELATVNAQLVRTNDQLLSEIRKLNSDQKARFDTLNKNVCNCESSTSAPNSDKPDLLIGSSILRDLVSNNQKHLVIKSHGGSKTNDILKILNRMKNKEFGDLLIQVGSNDCATKKPVQEIVENFDKMVEAAKRVSSTGHVTLGGICPRTDDGDAAARGTELNSRLQQLAETRGCVHADHDGTFLCRNGDVNSALLLVDGLHLSEAGSKALLDNFNLSSKADVRLGRGIRDRGPSRPASTPCHHVPQQHGLNGADHRSSPAEPLNSDGRNTPRNAWGPGPHHHPHKDDQRRTYHQQPPRRDRATDPREDAHRDSTHHEEERGVPRSFMNKNSYNISHPQFSRKSPNESRVRQPRCWYCNERGHTYRQCHRGDYVECRDCGELGHKSKHCEFASHDY